MVGVYFVLETLCDNNHQEEMDPKTSDFNTTLDVDGLIQTPDGGGLDLDMDQLGVTTLGKDDALRLRYGFVEMCFCEGGLVKLWSVKAGGWREYPVIFFSRY